MYYIEDLLESTKLWEYVSPNHLFNWLFIGEQLYERHPKLLRCVEYEWNAGFMYLYPSNPVLYALFPDAH